MSNDINKLQISKNIKNLYLDPNNYRFVDDSEYSYIAKEDVIKENVQKRTRKFIEGKKFDEIKDLIESFKTNGYLNVDVIQATDLGINKYLIIEGNRRVATLKYLQEQFKDGFSIGKLDPQIFGKIPFEIHNQDEVENHLIIMGLKHISGNKKWSPINQAKLIYDYLLSYKYDKKIYQEKEEELSKSLAITKQKLRNSQRAFHFILSYKNSDFGDQFDSKMYSIFEETVKNPLLKEWLEWNGEKYEAKKLINQERFFSWLSQIDELDDRGEGTRIRNPIITTAFEIRDLATFINDKNALEVLEEKKSITRVLYLSGTEDRNTIDKSINAVKLNVKSIKRYFDILEDDDVEELVKLREELNKIIPKREKLDILTSNATNYFELGDIKHYSEINISNYKIFKDFTFKNLKRINILVGVNNSGKTTLLEAIYLLCNQNDISGLLQLTKARNKIFDLDPQYLKNSLNEKSNISGKFNKINVEVEIEKYNDPDIDKADDYVMSLKMLGTIDGRSLKTTMHTYEYNKLKREYEQVEHVCDAFISSPYMYDLDKIISLYNKTLEIKIQGITAYEKVMGFIKKIDPAINDIFFTEDNGQKKFVVDSSKFPKSNMDLTSYGEGILRIFELALSFASCRNGVLLIDEFETAIHFSLLVEFTKFVQSLANEFNVQVFLTTHSKECIDAFVMNDYMNSDISAYLLENDNNEIKAEYIDGEELEYMVNSINIDIRGGAVDED